MQLINLGRIDPASMTRQQEHALQLFLQANPSTNFFERLQDYSVKYYSPDDAEDIMFCFSLTQNIVRRERKPGKSGFRFEVYNDNRQSTLAKNMVNGSKTMSSQGVLIPQQHRLLFKDKPRALGVHTHFTEYPKQITTIRYTLTRHIAHMHAKPPTFADVHDIFGGHTKSFSSMRLLPGMSLRSLINEEIMGSISLTFNQRLDISINIITAVKTQVHERGFIHRDLKPENIVVDPASGKVFIIDFELSKISADPEHRPLIGGTFFYQPIEQFEDNEKGDCSVKYSDKVDSYALGKTLAELWHVAFPYGTNIVECLQLSKSVIKFDYRSSKLKPEPDNHATNKISQVIEMMTQPNQQQRLDITGALYELELARLESRLATAKQHEESELVTHSIKQAYQAGINFRNAWQNSSQTASILPYLLNKHLSPDACAYPSATELFLLMTNLNLRILQDCNTREEIMNRLEAEFQKKDKYLIIGKQLQSLYEACDASNATGKRASDSHKLTSLLNKAANFQGDADELCDLNDRLSQALFHFEPYSNDPRNTEEMLNELTCPMNTEDSSYQLRLKVKECILTYFEDMQFSKNSNPPIKVISKILQLTNATNSAAELSASLQQLIEPSTSLSLLFRASRTLYQNVLQTIRMFEQLDRIPSCHPATNHDFTK